MFYGSQVCFYKSPRSLEAVQSIFFKINNISWIPWVISNSMLWLEIGHTFIKVHILQYGKFLWQKWNLMRIFWPPWLLWIFYLPLGNKALSMMLDKWDIFQQTGVWEGQITWNNSPWDDLHTNLITISLYFEDSLGKILFIPPNYMIKSHICCTRYFPHSWWNLIYSHIY